MLLLIWHLLSRHQELALWGLNRLSTRQLLLLVQVFLPYFSNVGRQIVCGDVVQLLMVDQYLRRKPLEDPGMSKCLIWGHTSCRVPMKASLNKVYEGLIIAFKNLIQVLRCWLPDLAPLAWYEYRSAIILEELLPSLTIFKHIWARYPAYFHHHSKLLHLVLARE